MNMSNLFTPILAQAAHAAGATEQPAGLGDAAILVAEGFTIVIGVLALLAVITSAIGAYFNKKASAQAASAAQEARKAAEAANAAAQAANNAAQASGTASGSVQDYLEEHLPAILAATHTVTGGTGRPVSITPVNGTAAAAEDELLMPVIAAAVYCVIGERPHRILTVRATPPGWAQEGRRQIFSSHRVR